MAIKPHQRAYRLRNAVKISAYMKAWRAQNAVKLVEYSIRRAPRDKRELRVYHAQYYLAHPEKFKYQPDRKRSLKDQLKHRLSQRLRCALRGETKTATTMNLVGCTRQALRAHLEATMRPGMTWANSHIDHIRPCASFDLTKPEDQRACFHWTNLQMLPAAENRAKGARWQEAA